MNRTRCSLLAAMAILGLLAASLTFSRASAQEKVPAPTQRWEYRTVRGLNVSEFNKVGESGWELCAAGSTTLFVFKRPKP